MAFPAENFPSLEALRTYVNANIIPNGMNLINGTEANNAFNSLITYVEQAPLNWATASLSSSTGAVVVGPMQSIVGPVVVFNAVPLSLAWVDNGYFQYVFINTTGTPIPLASGFSYFDNFGNPQTFVGPNQTVIIYKGVNGLWIQGNNSVTSSSIPSLVPGKFLTNTGSLLTWSNNYLKIQVAAFTNPTTYSNIALSGLYFDLEMRDLPGFLLGPDDPAPEWDYEAGGGFNILNGINLQNLSYPVYLWVKSQPGL